MLYSIVHVSMETTKNDKFYLSIKIFHQYLFHFAKFQLVSCNPSLAMICQMTYTHKLSKLCSATLIRHPVNRDTSMASSVSVSRGLLASRSDLASFTVLRRFSQQCR